MGFGDSQLSNPVAIHISVDETKDPLIEDKEKELKSAEEKAKERWESANFEMGNH